MSARHYGRKVKLTLYKPLGLNTYQTEKTTIEDLRVAFSIEKTLEKHPNKCDITITNLSELSRKQFETKPLHVVLEAGYDDNVQQIFTGDMRYATNKQDGPDWHTVVELADGDRSYRHGRLTRSFRAGTKKQDVIKLLFSSMGLTLNPKDLAKVGGQFASGFVAAGNCANEISKVLTSLSLTWSIQDGKPQILGADDTRSGIVRISSDSGLIGSPEFAAPEKKKAQPNLTFETLLTPELLPGSLVYVDARSVKGTFKVVKLTHVGDTHGSEFKTQVEAKGFKL